MVKVKVIKHLNLNFILFKIMLALWVKVRYNKRVISQPNTKENNMNELLEKINRILILIIEKSKTMEINEEDREDYLIYVLELRRLMKILCKMNFNIWVELASCDLFFNMKRVLENYRKEQNT